MTQNPEKHIYCIYNIARSLVLGFCALFIMEKKSIALVRWHDKVPTSHFSAYTGLQRAGESSACQIQSDPLPRVKEGVLSVAGLVAPFGYAGF